MDDIGFLVMRGGYLLVREATNEGYSIALPGDSINIAFPESKTRRGRVGHGVAQTILTGNEQVVVVQDRCIQMGTLRGGKWERMYDECRRYYDPEGIAPTLPTNGGGHHEVKIGEVKPVLVGGLGEKKSNSGTQFYQQDRVYATDGVAMAHPAQIPHGSYAYEVEDKNKDVRVRRLTERECWRLMGFDDSDFDKAKKVVSGTQLYKQAGNSIVVNVLEAIFVNLKPYFREEEI